MRAAMTKPQSVLATEQHTGLTAHQVVGDTRGRWCLRSPTGVVLFVMTGDDTRLTSLAPVDMDVLGNTETYCVLEQQSDGRTALAKSGFRTRDQAEQHAAALNAQDGSTRYYAERNNGRFC